MTRIWISWCATYTRSNLLFKVFWNRPRCSKKGKWQTVYTFIYRQTAYLPGKFCLSCYTLLSWLESVAKWFGYPSCSSLAYKKRSLQHHTEILFVISLWGICLFRKHKSRITRQRKPKWSRILLYRHHCFTRKCTSKIHSCKLTSGTCLCKQSLKMAIDRYTMPEKFNNCVFPTRRVFSDQCDNTQFSL